MSASTTVSHPEAVTAPALACIDCGAALDARPSLAGELLDCPDCGLELEVRSLTPLVLAAAPAIEEDWGE